MSALHLAAGPDLTATELYGLLKLRVDVFVVEQSCPYAELDGLDLHASTLHLWWQPDGVDEPLACLRILDQADGTLRIGRVCTAADARGTGLGSRLMTAALDRVGSADTVLNAQVQAQGMYARFGYQPVGDPFDDDGIQHVTMRRAGA